MTEYWIDCNKSILRSTLMHEQNKLARNNIYPLQSKPETVLKKETVISCVTSKEVGLSCREKSSETFDSVTMESKTDLKFYSIMSGGSGPPSLHVAVRFLRNATAVTLVRRRTFTVNRACTRWWDTHTTVYRCSVKTCPQAATLPVFQLSK